MKKLLAAIAMTSLAAHAVAQTTAPMAQESATSQEAPATSLGAAPTIPGAGAAGAAANGNLTPLYVGASAVGVAVVAAALNDGGSHNGTQGTTGTTGTTGAH